MHAFIDELFLGTYTIYMNLLLIKCMNDSIIKFKYEALIAVFEYNIDSGVSFDCKNRIFNKFECEMVMHLLAQRRFLDETN